MASVLMRWWLLAAAVLGAFSGTAEAALIVDQENVVINGGAFFLGGGLNNQVGQTFTVGATGTLGRVEVQLTRSQATITAPVRIDIVRTTDGLPDFGGGVLATLSLPGAGLPVGINTETLTGVDLGGMAFPVSQGEVLAIVLSVPMGTLFYWDVSNDVYPRGHGLFRTDLFPDRGFIIDNSDRGFRTYVETTAVPEPSSLALGAEAAVALLGGAWLRWRQSAAVRT